MMNEHIEQQEEKVIMAATEGRLKRYVVEGADGRDLFITYDTQTTLTIVHDYAPGRSLIFKGSELNAIHTMDIQDDLLDLNIAMLVDNAELEASSPLQIWNAMRAEQVK